VTKQKLILRGIDMWVRILRIAFAIIIALILVAFFCIKRQPKVQVFYTPRGVISQLAGFKI
jgi:hypothetical protein